MKTKTELKKIMQSALKSEYGFAPSLANINLLEASRNGAYIRAEVLGKEYRFNSYTFLDGSVWVGHGTITKVA